VFVDCHTHVVPSGDDGAATIEDGLALCRTAWQHGTAVLFATPHVWPHLTLTPQREEEIREAFERMRGRAAVELRLGYELTPARPLLDEDPHRYLLEGTDRVLMEVPFAGPADIVFALAEHVEAAGLRPVIAHPERTEAVLDEPSVAEELAARGWTLQVNATSLTGRHGGARSSAGRSSRGCVSSLRRSPHDPPHTSTRPTAHASASARLSFRGHGDSLRVAVAAADIGARRPLTPSGLHLAQRPRRLSDSARSASRAHE
jgi:protein-tyrosine phosphatase